METYISKKMKDEDVKKALDMVRRFNRFGVSDTGCVLTTDIRIWNIVDLYPAEACICRSAEEFENVIRIMLNSPNYYSAKIETSCLHSK